jgi:hypothetical protein
MMLVSIHSSSVWTERNSCIDTCLHASIHASEKPTCIDTNIHLYRYKRVKTDLCIYFHSFIHQTPNTSSSTRKSHQKPSFPNSQSPSKLNQNSQNLTLNHFKFFAHSHSFINIVVQVFNIFTFKTRVFNFSVCGIFFFSTLNKVTLLYSSL